MGSSLGAGRVHCGNCGVAFCDECLLHAGRLPFYAQFRVAGGGKAAAREELQPLCNDCFGHVRALAKAADAKAVGLGGAFEPHFGLCASRGVPRRCAFWRVALPPSRLRRRAVDGMHPLPLSAPRRVPRSHCLGCGDAMGLAGSQGAGGGSSASSWLMGALKSVVKAAVLELDDEEAEDHCRACGHAFCPRCLPHFLALPFVQFDDAGPQPVCADCYSCLGPGGTLT